MFERYTEKARRVIFFARYEASQFGSPTIDAEHLLLGLLREDKRAYRWAPKAQPPQIVRQRIENWISRKPVISTAVDLPLSDASKNVLQRAKDEADRLNSKHIGTEHLFLALLQEPDSPTAKLLLELGGDVEKLRAECASQPYDDASPSAFDQVRERLRSRTPETIIIHGTPRPLPVILAAAARLRYQPFYWQKRSWTVRDAAVERKSGKLSLDLSLAEDSSHFELRKGAWKMDPCLVCHWELFEAKDDADHGIGYTNGRDWVCTECFDRFWDRPDFISGAYSEIT